MNPKHFILLVLSLAIITLSAVSCTEDLYLHPEHLVYGYTDRPWDVLTKSERVSENANIDDLIYYSQRISGFEKTDQLLSFYLKQTGKKPYTSGTKIYEDLCEKHGDREKPPFSWEASRQSAISGNLFSIIDFSALEVYCTEDFDATHPAGSSLLDILHFATTSPNRVLRNNYQIYFDTDVLYTEDGKQLFNIRKRGIDVIPEDLSILSFFILSFDKLPEPLEPKHIHVCLTADDGKVYDFETLLTFQELDYHSSTY